MYFNLNFSYFEFLNYLLKYFILKNLILIIKNSLNSLNKYLLIKFDYFKL